MKFIHRIWRKLLGYKNIQIKSSITGDESNLALWANDINSVLELVSSRNSGLNNNEVEERAEFWGKNELKPKKQISRFKIFINQFKSPLIFLLIGAAILAFFLNEWLNTIVISLAVLVNVTLGFFQEYHAEKTLEKLTLYIKQRVRVTRSGIDQEIDAIDIVPGDIINLTYGSRVPADARLININNLTVDESILTGESLPVRKDLNLCSEGALVSERKNMVFAGTLVSEGYGTAVVYRTGLRTELGKIATLVASSKRDQTPLQNSLSKFGWFIFYTVILIVFGIFILGISRGVPVGDMLILSAAIAVGAIPEALPIALTVILAIGAERLALKNGIMRSLSAVETLGSANLIMTDKTGTLTEAKMRLVDIMPLSDILNKREVLENEDNLPQSIQKDLLKLAISNIDVAFGPKDELGNQTFVGRPLEVNIAIGANKNGIEINKDKKRILLPFSSTYKFSVGQDFDSGNIVVMGAPDILLDRSNISKDQFLVVSSMIDKISHEGNRLLGLAKVSQDLSTDFINKPINPNDVKNLEFVGLIILRDPVRKEVPEAVKRIQDSGAKVVIVTGDMVGTAVSVAKELGFDIKQNNIISGADLHQLSDEELLANLPNIKVFARVTPEDKLRIGNLYKKLGNIIAMTGDGVNDAPSLKIANIGIALGSGSDVAKSAADLVLLDDNFKTIVLAIEEGRRILSNIRKAFVYLMSSVFDGVILLGGSLIFALPLPLTALHIIWINFFTGSLPALSFAFDDNYDGHIIKKDLKSKSIFNKEVIILTAGVGILTSVLLFVLYKVLLDLGISFGETRSIIFACFSLYVVFAAYSFRSLYKPIYAYPVFSNKILNRSIIFSTIMCVVTLAVPFMRKIFELEILPKESLYILPLWFIVNILLIEITKWGFRLYRNKKN